MKAGERVEVLVAVANGYPAWTAGRIVASITEDKRTTYNVRGDDGRYFERCAAQSMRTIVCEEQQ